MNQESTNEMIANDLGAEAYDDDYEDDFHQTHYMEEGASSFPTNDESKYGSLASYPQRDGLVQGDEKGSSSKHVVEANQASSISPKAQIGEGMRSATRNYQAQKKQPVINFNSAVAVSSDNMSFQYQSDKADTVAHTIADQEDSKDTRSRRGNQAANLANVSTVSDATNGGVFSQKSSTSQKTFGSQSQISRRPPAHNQGMNQKNMKRKENNLATAKPMNNDQNQHRLSGPVNIKSFLMNKTYSSQSQAYIGRKRSSSREQHALPQQLDSDSMMSKQQDQSIPQYGGESGLPPSPTKVSKDSQPSMVSKLLRGFKLNQYASKMSDFGYSQDIFKLTFLSHREREDLMSTLHLLPGHRERMTNLFKIVEQLNPKPTIRKTLLNAQKQYIKIPNQSDTRSNVNSYAQKTGSYQRAANYTPLSQMDARGRSSDILPSSLTLNQYQDSAPMTSGTNFQKTASKEHTIGDHHQIVFGTHQTQAFIAQISEGPRGITAWSADKQAHYTDTFGEERTAARAIQLQQQKSPRYPAYQSSITAQRTRSSSKGKGNDSDGLLGIYNYLEPAAKRAINEQFLTNIKSGRNHQSFHQALKQHGDQSQEKKRTKNALNQIFPPNKFTKNRAANYQFAQIYLQNSTNSNGQQKAQRYANSSIGQASRAGAAPGVPRPPLGQASASRTHRKQSYPAKGAPSQAGLPPPSQNLGARGIQNLHNNQSIQNDALKSTGALRSASNYARPRHQRASDYGTYETPEKNSIHQSIFAHNSVNQYMRRTSRHRSSSQSKHQAMGRGRSQRGPHASLIPVLSAAAHSDQKNAANPRHLNPSSRRSREGSNIGKGVDAGFFNRRNSSAKGPRQKAPGEGTSATNLGTHELHTINTSVGNQITTDKKISMYSNKSILPLVISPSENVRNQGSEIEVKHDPIQRHSDALNVQRHDFQNNLNLMDDQQFCKTEDHRGEGKNDVSRISRVSLGSKNTGATGAEQPGLPDRCTPNYSTPTEADGNYNQSQMMQEMSREIRQLESLEAKNGKNHEHREGLYTPAAEKSAKFGNLYDKKDQEYPKDQQSCRPPADPSREPIQPPSQPDLRTLEAVNDLTSPLLSKENRKEAMNYGYSFNSKRVAQGPTFFNLRIMCHCLGKALKRHIEFSGGTFWLLDELEEAKAKGLGGDDKDQGETERADLDQLDFSYHFQDDLKIPTSEKKALEREAIKRYADQKENEKTNEYASDEFEELEGTHVPPEVVGSLVGPFQQSGAYLKDSSRIILEGDQPLQEFLKIYKGLICSSASKRLGMSKPADQEDIEEDELEERDENIDDLEIHLDAKELRHIEQIRRDEIFKQTLKNEGDRLSNISKSNSYLQMQLVEKDKKIKELTQMVHKFEKSGKTSDYSAEVDLYEQKKVTRPFDRPGMGHAPSPYFAEILAVSGDPADGKNEFDLDDFDDDHPMTKAEFLMAQLDLDPIESQYSYEQKYISSHHQYVPNGRGGLSNKNTFPVYQSGRNKTKEGQQTGPQVQNVNEQTMGNGSINSVSQGISLKSSAGNIQALESIGGSAVFQSPSASLTSKMQAKPPTMSKSQQKFYPNSSNAQKQAQPHAITEGHGLTESEKVREREKKEKEKFDRLEQIAILRGQLRFFDERLEFDSEVFNEDKEVLEPSEEDIAAYGKYVTVASKMENETPIIALVYIERLLRKTGILVNKYNWKRVLLVCLCVASKVWDDDSLENVHFPKVMSDVTLTMINKLEQIFLDLFLNYDLVVRGSEYARYYFIMRSLADELRDESQAPEEKNAQRKKRRKRDDWAEFPLQAPISAQYMAQLQKNAARAEIYLKDRYELEVIQALADKFKAQDQKSRLRKFDCTV